MLLHPSPPSTSRTIFRIALVTSMNMCLLLVRSCSSLSRIFPRACPSLSSHGRPSMVPESTRRLAAFDDNDDDDDDTSHDHASPHRSRDSKVGCCCPSRCCRSVAFHFDRQIRYPLDSHAKSAGSCCGGPLATGESWHILGPTLLPSPVSRDPILGLALARNILSAAAAIHLIEQI